MADCRTSLHFIHDLEDNKTRNRKTVDEQNKVLEIIKVAKTVISLKNMVKGRNFKKKCNSNQAQRETISPVLHKQMDYTILQMRRTVTMAIKSCGWDFHASILEWLNSISVRNINGLRYKCTC